MEIMALYDNVLILAKKTEEEIREGGIIVPLIDRSPMQSSGIVWLTGEEVKNIKPGDTVYFQTQPLQNAMKIGDKRVFVMKEKYCYAVDKEVK